MKKEWLVKSLALGVVVLFIGVGIQPAISNEVFIPVTSSSEDDCLECQEVNNVELLKVKLLLLRLEIVTNIILSKLGDIPEIKDKCEKLLDIIHSTPMLGNNVIICNLLFFLLLRMYIRFRIIDELYFYFEETNPAIAEIVYFILGIYSNICYTILDLLFKYNCIYPYIGSTIIDSLMKFECIPPVYKNNISFKRGN